MSLLDRFRQGLRKTRAILNAPVSDLVRGLAVVEASTLTALEDALVAADFGPLAAAEILTGVRRDLSTGASTGEIRTTLARHVARQLEIAGPAAREGSPKVWFIVGVNGVGKTTTIGKLASRLAPEGGPVVVVAADTFRAAAVAQLETWAQRARATFVSSREGQDPASVVVDGLRRARALGAAHVIVDTAGRLQNKAHLMAELSKMGRVAAREVENAPHETLLILDATVGSNGLSQAQEFAKALPLTGLVLTKLDGTAKGGVAVAIVRTLGVPIRFAGLGESIEDLVPFDAVSFAAGLVAEPADSEAAVPTGA